MGVMACAKRDCDEIMCSTYVYRSGYICTGCQNDFIEYLKAKNKSPKSDEAISRRLEKFMDTQKYPLQPDNYDLEAVIRDFFSKH